MKDNFHTLLRVCRKEARLNQKELAEKINIDNSMISRFEKDTIPNPGTLQLIINALALDGVSRDILDMLWEASGHYMPNIADAQGADPFIPFVHQVLMRLESEDRNILRGDLRSIVELDQAYFSARKDSELRRWDKASQIFLDLRSKLEQRFQHIYLRVDHMLGVCLYNNGHYAEAIQHYESALWSARQLEEEYEEAEILVKLGNTHRRCGGDSEWDLASERYKKAQEIFEKLGDRIQMTNCLRRIAGVHLFRGQPEEARLIIDDCISRSTVEGDDRGFYKALQHKAWIYELLGQWDEAVELCEKALQIVETTRCDNLEIVTSLRYLADAYRLQRNIEKAFNTYKEALDKAQDYEQKGIGVNLVLGMIYLGLGKVYLKMPGKEFEAQECLNNSLKVHKGLGEDFRLADVLCEQGELLLKLNRYEEAEMRLNRASELFHSLKNDFHYANSLALLCHAYYKKNEPDNVFAKADEIRKIDNSLISYHRAKVDLWEGKSYVDQGNYQEAAKKFYEASNHALSFNIKSFHETCEDILNEIDRFAKKVKPEETTKLVNNYLSALETALENPQLPSFKQILINELSESLRRKVVEIEGLKPIS